MRFLGALKTDIKFQFNQGFYLLYMLMTLVYMLIVIKVPVNMKMIVVPLIIYTDPSFVGFFFIGGIVMLEKQQGVLNYIVITPLRSKEYLLSKVISLAILGVTAAIIIVFFTYDGIVKWITLIVGMLLTSIFFTLYGFIVAASCKTINEYFIKMIPYMLLIIFPCFSVIGFKYEFIFSVVPSVAGLKLIIGAFNNIGNKESLLYISFLLVANILMFFKVNNVFNNRIAYGGE